MKINKDKLYSLGEIVRDRLIPGVDTIVKASRLVKNAEAAVILKPTVVKRGFSGIQYQVLGENINEFNKHAKGL